MKRKNLTAFVAALCAASPVVANDLFNVSGEAEIGVRYYGKDGLFTGQAGAGGEAFVGLTLNADAQLANGEFVFQFSGVKDVNDSRDSIHLQKFYYNHDLGDTSILVGYNTENWGVVESRSVVNVLNPVSRVDPTLNPDRIGTPMFNINTTLGSGSLSFYGLLDMVQPEFGSAASRHRPLYETNPDRAIYEDENSIDLALRYTNNFDFGGGAVDISASLFTGTSRDPITLPGCIGATGTITEAVCTNFNAGVAEFFETGAIDSIADISAILDLVDTAGGIDAINDIVAGSATDAIVSTASAVPGVGFVPYYERIHQLGLEAVYARGDLQLKFEGILRKTRNDGYFAGVVGGDYTFNDVGNGDGSLTLALEYLYDGRGDAQPLTLFANDVFVGANYMFNNERDSQIQFGGFYDLDTSAQLYRLSASTRLTDSLRAEFNATKVITDGYNDPLSFVRSDNFAEFKLRSFF